jgi:ssDNA-binding Zn-finger/Zn-ribbon topoisomerase 1
MIMTPGALVALVEAQEGPKVFVSRHLTGDWGEVDRFERVANDCGLRHGERVSSRFQTRHGRRLFVITDRSRYAATISLAEELNSIERGPARKVKTVREANHEASKLDVLAAECGLTVSALIEEYALESVVPGICMNPDCDFTAEVEPDQREGWCEECGTPTVESGIVLAGLI